MGAKLLSLVLFSSGNSQLGSLSFCVARHSFLWRDRHEGQAFSSDSVHPFRDADR